MVLNVWNLKMEVIAPVLCAVSHSFGFPRKKVVCKNKFVLLYYHRILFFAKNKRVDNRFVRFELKRYCYMSQLSEAAVVWTPFHFFFSIQIVTCLDWEWFCSAKLLHLSWLNNTLELIRALVWSFIICLYDLHIHFFSGSCTSRIYDSANRRENLTEAVSLRNLCELT